jgi:NitT/TauT family transport system substrate-binding protein
MELVRRLDARRSRSRRGFARTLIATAAVFLAVLAGCGGDDAADQGGGSEGSPERVRLRVGETAGIPTAFMQFGVDKGFFADEGLDVQVVPVQGASPIITAVVSGDYEMGGSDTVTFSQAIARGLPLTMITPGTSVSGDPEKDFSAVLVAEDSPIRRPADLRGKTMAVNILGNITEVSVKGALEDAGVDPDSVRYTEVPFPDMAAAVESGDVDAAMVIEPFRTIGTSSGLRSVLKPFTGFQPGLQIGSIVTTRKYAEENADVVARFQRAHARTARHIAEQPAEFRKALPAIAEMKPALADAVALPEWKERVDPEAVDLVAEAMVRYGLVKEKPDVASAIAEGA